MSWFHLIALLLLMAAVLGLVNHLWLRLPRSIALMAGALLCSIGILATERLFPGVSPRPWLQQTVLNDELPHVFLDGVLAFMLFAGALHVDMAALRENRWLVLSLATIGVLISTALFGGGMYLVFAGDVPLIWCLVLGAILSPTDPIAVGDMLRRVGLPTSLQAIIAGESLFNDGVAVVVFSVLLGIATGNDGLDLGHVAGLFLIEAVGGALLGLVTGYVAYCAMRLIDEYNLEITISLALVTGTYSLADTLGMSGPIAVVVAGLLIGHRATRFAMSDTTRAQLTTFWSLVDELLNTILFLLLGFVLLSLEDAFRLPWTVAGAIGLSLLTRLISVGLPAAWIDLPWLRKARGTVVLTWGGLRGGIPVALALSLPGSSWREMLLTVCYGVVVFTIIVQGLSMTWVIRQLYGRSGEPSTL